jgi:hypothetical protein
VSIYITDGWTHRRFRKLKTTAREIYPEERHVSVSRGITWLDVWFMITTPR